MRTARNRIDPYLQIEFDAAEALVRRGDDLAGFRRLERAHVLGQKSTRQHVRAHWRMLLWGVRRHDVREIAGQVFRILGAATMTVFGLVPRGNTGGANVSPFRAMPIPDDLSALVGEDTKPSWRRVFVFVVLVSLIGAAMTLSGAQAEHEARTAIVDGHRVTFRVLGSGRPAVVMISGLGDGMTTFDDVAAELAKTRMVIVYDRAGYGGSERANGPRDAVAAARELSGLLAQSGVAGPFVVSGHSLGGLFAEYYAATHPEQVAGLILEDSRPADFTRRCMASAPGAMCVLPAWLVWFMPKAARDEVAALSDVMDQVEAVAPIQGKPVLVLSQPDTDADENSWGALWTEAQSDLAARYPGSRHLIAGSGGHYVHDDQREWFVASVQAFLDQIR